MESNYRMPVRVNKSIRASSGSEHAPRQVLVDRLFLDAENPRLAAETGSKAPLDLLKILWEQMAVDEVALSIAANGFFEEEPLFVVPKDGPKKPDEKPDEEEFVVVEGNRRLAAVKLLLDDSLRRKVGASELPPLSTEIRDGIKKLPVSVYETREELWAFFGFRHINGPKPWDAFSKAKYVADVHEQMEVPLKEIARRIGDRHSTVARLYRGYKLLVVAERAGIYDKQDRYRNRFYFSHLYTAADQPDFQKFLGITPDRFGKPNKAHLKDLMLWLYGSRVDKKEPVVKTQFPDLNYLRAVVTSPQALAALRAGYSLERSHEISIGDAQRFREALTRAKEDVQQAKATVTTGFSGERDLLEIMDDILRVAATVKSEMERNKK